MTADERAAPDPVDPVDLTDVAALVLAAGGGSRFAGASHKLLAPLGGRPLVEWAVAAAASAGLGHVVVVCGAVDVSDAARRAGGPAVVVVDHSAWRDGQGTSLKAGLDRCQSLGCRAAVIGLGDQPLLGPGPWRAVARSTLAPVVTATFAGRRSPPVRLDASVWEMLSSSGNEGARELMRRRPDLVAEVACEGDPTDVDTLEDLHRAQAAASGPRRGGGGNGSNDATATGRQGFG